METYPIQTNFSGGEITPRLHAREDVGIYATALEFCENFMPTPQGSLLMRPGTQYKSDSVGDSNVSRLFTFERGISTDVVVELNGSTLRLIGNDGALIEGESGQLIRDPTFLNGFAQWMVLKGVNVNYLDPVEPGVPPRTVQLTSGTGVGCSIPQIFGPLDVGWDQIKQRIGVAIEETTFTLSVSVFDIETLPGGGEPDNFINIRIGNTEGAADLVDATETLDVIGQTVELEYIFTPAGTAIWLEIDTGPTPTDPNFYAIRKVTVRAMHMLGNDLPSPGPIEYVSPWPEESVAEIQIAMDTAKGYLFFFQKDTPVHWLTFDRLTNIWVFEPVDDTLLPSEWDVTNGFPRCGTIHQGRLWAAGTIAEPSAVWGSEVWDYLDWINPGGDPNPGDAIKFVLSAPGTVLWIESVGSELTLGTDIAEVVGSSTSGVIVFDDFHFNSDTKFGSAQHEAIHVAGDVVFMTTDRSHLRRLYDTGDTKYAYNTQDMSYLGEHLLHAKIREIEYAQIPFYQLFVLLTTGRFVGCMYDVSLELQAWFRSNIGDEVLSTTVTRDLEGAGVWMVVRRDGDLTIEALYIDEDLVWNLDSWEVGLLDITTKVASGFEGLKNKTVSVVLLGSGLGEEEAGYQLHPDVTIDSEGNAQLEDWADGVPVAGFGYTATAKTLPPATGGNRTGSSQSTLRRWTSIFVRLSSSGIPKLNGQRPEPRFAVDPMNLSPPVATGDYETEDLDWDRGQIEIIQDLPIRTEIIGLFGKTGTGTL